MLTALFADRNSAERAYRCISELGYEQPEINVIMSAETREHHFSGSPQTPLSRNAAASAETKGKAAEQLGGPTGGTIGTVAPVAAAIGAALLLVPGVGIAVAGPIGVALTAATAVGVAGGLVGALTNWGVPRARIEEYEAGIRGGGILLGVKARSADDVARLHQCLQASGGRAVQS